MKKINGIFLLICFLLLGNIAKAQNIIQPVSGLEEWQRLFLSAYKIDGQFQSFAYSSELDEVPAFEGGFGKYTILNLFDNDPATAWVEGVAGYGEGEKIVIGLGKEMPDKLLIRNGYQKSGSIFNSNSKPKTIKLTFYTGFFLEGEVTEIASIYRIRKLIPSFTFLLKDTMGVQEIPINLDPQRIIEAKNISLDIFKEVFSKNIEEVKKYCPDCDNTPVFEYLLMMEIIDVYKGSKWDDTCISDFEAVYTKKKQQGIPEEDTIEDVYESDDMGSGLIFVDTDRERQLILVDKAKMKEIELLSEGTTFEIVLMDISPDKEWAQVNIMFYEEGAGRVEEYSALYHTRTLQRIDSSLVDIIYGLNGFVEEDGKTWLDTVKGMIDLEKIEDLLKKR